MMKASALLPIFILAACSQDERVGRVGSSISVEPRAVELETPIGVIARHKVTVKNIGAVVLKAESIALVDPTDDLALAFDAALPTSLRPGESIELEVRHIPRDRILDSATLRVVSDDPDEQTIDVPIAQSGVGGPVAAVVRDVDVADIEADTRVGISTIVQQIPLGVVVPGVRKQDLVFAINAGTGNVPLAIDSVQLINAPAELTMTIAPEAPVLLPRLGAKSEDALVRSIAITLAWAPTAAGTTLASILRIKSNDAAHPSLEIPITGSTEAGPPPSIRLVPPGGLALGTQIEGTFTAFNDGGSTLTIEALAIENDAMGAFALTDPAAAVAIAPGQFHAYRISFTPGIEPSYTATVKIRSNDPARGSIDYPISAGTVGPMSCTPSQPDVGEPTNSVCSTAIVRGALALGIDSTETMTWNDSLLDSATDEDWSRIDLSIAQGCLLSGLEIGATAATQGETAEVCIRIGDCSAPDREQCAHGSSHMLIFPADAICDAHGNNVPVYVRVRVASGTPTCMPYRLDFNAR